MTLNPHPHAFWICRRGFPARLFELIVFWGLGSLRGRNNYVRFLGLHDHNDHNKEPGGTRNSMAKLPSVPTPMPVLGGIVLSKHRNLRGLRTQTQLSLVQEL